MAQKGHMATLKRESERERERESEGVREGSVASNTYCVVKICTIGLPGPKN